MNICRHAIFTACTQELVGHPMYTELVEGEDGKVKPQDNGATVAGVKKLLIDVSNISYRVSCCIQMYIAGNMEVFAIVLQRV